MATETKKLTKAQATALVKKIRNASINYRQLMLDFLRGRGWEAMGYKSIHECWEGEGMGADFIGSAVAKVLIIQALDEDGMAVDEIVTAVKGIGRPSVVLAVLDNLTKGISVDRAYPAARNEISGQGGRKGTDYVTPPTPPQAILVRCESPQEREVYVQMADAEGLSVADFALRALRIYADTKSRGLRISA